MDDEDLLAQLSYHRKEYFRLSALTGVRRRTPSAIINKPISEPSLYKLIADSSQDVISIHDPGGTFIFCSPAIINYGFAPDEVIGKSIYQIIHPDDLARVADHHTSAGSLSVPIRYRIITKDNTYRWVETVSKPTQLEAEPYVVSCTRNVEHQKIEEDKIRDLAIRLDEANKLLEEMVMTDPLTAIGNRRHFLSRLDLMILEAERDRPLSVMLLDVDNFKLFNDSFGHVAGDDALKQVAETLQKKVRRIDCLARYGGEEFVVASNNNFQDSLVLSEKLRRSVEAIQNRHRPITVSIGLAEYATGDSVKMLVAKADQALYKSKSTGKNRVTAFKY